MNKVKSELISIDKLKHIINSRMLMKNDVADLMNDIKQNGLLQNIAVRQKDNAVIYGNRRIKAMKNLGHDKIMADFFADVSDEELLIMNLSENIKRKGINSIEIGRAVEQLMSAGLRKDEIASKLSIAPSRVNACLVAYKVTKGTPFEDAVMFGHVGVSRKGIPETLIITMQTLLGRAFPRGVITKSDWMLLLKAAKDGQLNAKNISALRNILLFQGPNVTKALRILDDSHIVYANIVVDEKEFAKEKSKWKTNSDLEVIKRIITKHNKKLLF